MSLYKYVELLAQELPLACHVAEAGSPDSMGSKERSHCSCLTLVTAPEGTRALGGAAAQTA